MSDANRSGILEKVVLVGPAQSGKSNLLLRITDDHFNPTHDLTIGVEFGARNSQVSIGNTTQNVRFQIWDTAGQDSFRNITRSYYHGANIIAVCVSVDDANWVNKVTALVSEAKRWAPSEAKIVFVATKSDTGTGSTTYTEAMRKYAEDKEYPFFVTSAQIGKYTDTDGREKNIHEDFGDSLAREMGDELASDLESKQASVREPTTTISSSVSSSESDPFDETFGLYLTGIGFLMLTFAFLTFPPFHLIPQPGVSTFLALFGSVFSLGGFLALTYSNWFGSNWEKENKGRVVALAVVAFVFAAALITFFALSLGSYSQLFSDTFTDHSEYKVYSQIALLATGVSFALGFVASLYQCINVILSQNKNTESSVASRRDLGALLPQDLYYRARNQHSNTASMSVSSTSNVSSAQTDSSATHEVSHTPSGPAGRLG